MRKFFVTLYVLLVIGIASAALQRAGAIYVGHRADRPRTSVSVAPLFIADDCADNTCETGGGGIVCTFVGVNSAWSLQTCESTTLPPPTTTSSTGAPTTTTTSSTTTTT